jgi:hypothetical protein
MISPPINQRKIGNRYHAAEDLFSAIPATLPQPTSFTIPQPPPTAPDAVVSWAAALEVAFPQLEQNFELGSIFVLQ